MHHYWKLPHFFVIRVTICRVRMSRYWALKGTVAHICKHNKQFLKHNMIFLEHNKHFSKHNMVLSKHNKRLSKHDTVLLKDNTIISWLWLAMIRSLCGWLKSLIIIFPGHWHPFWIYQLTQVLSPLKWNWPVWFLYISLAIKVCFLIIDLY